LLYFKFSNYKKLPNGILKKRDCQFALVWLYLFFIKIILSTLRSLNMVSANLLLHTVMLYIFIYSMIAIFFDVSSFRQVVTELGVDKLVQKVM